MRYFYLALFAILISCQKGNKDSETSSASSNDSLSSSISTVQIDDTSPAIIIENSCLRSRNITDYLQTISQKDFLDNNYESPMAYSASERPFLSFQYVDYRPGQEDSIRVMDNKIGESWNNDFMKSLFLSFSRHHNFEITPDMIWLIICQGVANHINSNEDIAQQLNTTGLDKNIINVRNDTISYGVNDSAWRDVTEQFTEALTTTVDTNHIQLMTPTFSTTEAVHHVAFQITLINSVQSFNEYHLYTKCGIPKLRIQGTRDDWLWIYKQVDSFAEYGLNEWISIIKPHLEQFVSIYDESPDNEFWNSIFKIHSYSGEPLRITGWIKDFFPYRISESNTLESNPFLGNNEYEDVDADVLINKNGDTIKLRVLNPPVRGLKATEFPRGVLDAPFIWHYGFKEYTMKLNAGFIGATYDRENDFIIPEIGWTVQEVK
jgi:hypothetical protein